MPSKKSWTEQKKIFKSWMIDTLFRDKKYSRFNSSDEFLLFLNPKADLQSLVFETYAFKLIPNIFKIGSSGLLYCISDNALKGSKHGGYF